MSSGRVYFRDMNYEDLHRLQFDLETTALDPHRGRIFLVAIYDNRGCATTLEASTPDEEAQLIKDLCELIRQRDPDVIENHNLFGFDLPFLEQRASILHIPLHLGRQGGPPQLERREETLAIGPEARRRTRYSIAGRELIDTLDAVRRYDFVVRDCPVIVSKRSHAISASHRPSASTLKARRSLTTYRANQTWCVTMPWMT